MAHNSHCVGAMKRAWSLLCGGIMITGCFAGGTVGGGPRPPQEQPEPPAVPEAPFKPVGPVTRADPGVQSADKYGDPIYPSLDITVTPPPPIDRDPLSHLPTGQTQLDNVCARGLQNAVTDAFCGATAPQIGSLRDLQRTLGLEFVNPNGGNDQGGNPAFAITGHSSSLVTRAVSAINPRVVIFNQQRNDREDDNFLAMGFVRGDTFAELAVQTPPENNQPGELTFYLLKFEKACGENCTNGDLLTPDVERDWASWTLYQDEDLKNSTLDCLQCHQPDGPSSQKIYRMQELQNPWTHWFRDNREGGQALLEDYQAAHDQSEEYGGIPGNLISESDPANLEDFVRDAGFDLQPNEFRTNQIEGEVQDSNGQQPELNMPPGVSQTWLNLYDEAVAGMEIPPPYHDVKVTDPAKLQEMTLAYRSVMSGEMPKASLPDIREVFLEAALPAMSMRPKPGLNGRETLIHMCGQCHNSRLDQSLTRARFNVFELESMSRAEKDLAIRRLRKDKEDRYLMPPRQFKELSDDEIELVVQELLK